MSNINTIIIGAGAAGLAVGACLQQAGISNVILEQSDRIGATWRKHYDRLHLHTDKNNSALPFMPMPSEYPRYASRDQVVTYLESYANKYDLDIRFNQRVVSARSVNNQWEVQTQDPVHSVPNLVVACGYARQPLMPSWQGLESFPGKVMHSSAYKNGSAFNKEEGSRCRVRQFGR